MIIINEYDNIEVTCIETIKNALLFKYIGTDQRRFPEKY